jgi:methylated-DNA-protein-cysteine methyltransferase related protein
LGDLLQYSLDRYRAELLNGTNGLEVPLTASNYQKIYRVIEKIPRGKVATYGQVATLAGLPGHARQAGYALAALPNDHDLPWQRVVNARGEISRRSEPGSEGLQRALLEAEGVVFDTHGRIDLKRFLWRPRSKSQSSA